MRCTTVFIVFVLLISGGLLKTKAQVYAFDHFATERGMPVSIANHSIYTPNGNFFIATEGGGLASYNGRTLRLIESDNPQPTVYINQLYFSQETLYLATANGLFEWRNNIFNTLIDSINFSCFCNDKSGTLYAGSQKGLWALEGGNWTSHHTESTIQTCLFVGDTLYLGTKEGLFRKLPNTSNLQLIQDDIDIRIIKQHPKTKNLIIGTATGALAFHLESNALEPLVTNSFTDVRGIAFTENGMWLGSYGGGLLYLNADRAEETPLQITTENGLPSDNIRHLQIDSFGKLWISSIAGWSKLITPAITNYITPEKEAVVALIDAEKHGAWIGGEFEVYPTEAPELAKKVGNVFALHAQENGSLWMGTETGLFLLKNKRVLQPQHASQQDLAFVLSLASHGDTLYVGSADGLFAKYDDQLERLTFNTVSFGAVTDLATTTTNLYIHAMGQGIFSWNRTTGSLDLLPQTDKINIATLTTVNQELWVGTNGEGLFIFKNEELKSRYQSNAGLLSNNIWAITPIDTESVWLGTEKGLQEVKNLAGQVTFSTIITRKDGLLDPEVSRGALFFNSRSNVLSVGTRSGYSQIQLNQLNSFSVPPIVSIPVMNLFFQPLDRSKSGRPINKPAVFSHDQNYLSFEFAATSGYADEQLQFQYILEGQDQNWTPANEKRDAIFTNIQPGKYTFRIQAKDPIGNLGEMRYSFEIRPAFYQTIWFYILLLALIGSVVFAIIRQRIRVLNEKLALESQRAEWERKALRLQMNPHFIFNALDGITGFIFKNDSKSAVKYLSNFAKLMRLTLESSRESFIPLETEIQILKNYLALEQLRFSNQFDFEITVTETIDRYGTIPPMMLQPHVENAILHGLRSLPEDKKGKVTVAFTAPDRGKIKCTITDNGIGRTAAAQLKAQGKIRHKSLASTITQNRITLFERTYGKGFGFEIDDLETPDGKALGTRVLITLPFQEDEVGF